MAPWRQVEREREGAKNPFSAQHSYNRHSAPPREKWQKFPQPSQRNPEKTWHPLCRELGKTKTASGQGATAHRPRHRPRKKPKAHPPRWEAKFPRISSPGLSDPRRLGRESRTPEAGCHTPCPVCPRRSEAKFWTGPSLAHFRGQFRLSLASPLAPVRHSPRIAPASSSHKNAPSRLGNEALAMMAWAGWG